MITFRKIIKILLYPLAFVEIALLKAYKKIISPMINSCCPFVPSCSIYMQRCIKEYDAILGVFIGCKRLLKCNKNHCGKFDLEPSSIIGDYKWIC